jgi:hypothetical protein
MYYYIPKFFVGLGSTLGFDTKTGTIGDTIGGTLGPFIAIIAAILTFMAFYIQYQANQQQRVDLTIERFENKFFEMLRLHKENLNEMYIDGYDIAKVRKEIISFSESPVNEETIEHVSKVITGRKVFITMYSELKACHEICAHILQNDQIIDKDRYLIKLSYRLVFNGAGTNIIESVDDKVSNDKDYVKRCKDALLAARKKHVSSASEENKYVFPGTNKVVLIPIKYKPFAGHVRRLGHYYRHLYMMVKYVAKQDEKHFSMGDKRDYLRMLRAQLTGHEQLLLYFNYLSGYGKNWENKENHFFSDYRMIHNLPFELTKFTIDPQVEFADQIKLIKLQHEEMFEYDED